MRFYRDPHGFVAVGSAKSATRLDRGKTFKLDTLTGSVLTLPAALGDGCRFRVFETLAATSNAHVIKVGNTTDVFVGSVTISGTTTMGFAPAAADDTITMNRTTTGGAVKGAWFDLEDIAPGVWAVRGSANGSGAVATPFSSTV